MNEFPKDEILKKFLDILYGKFPSYFEGAIQEILLRNFKLHNEVYSPYGRVYFNGISYPIRPISFLGELVYLDMHADLAPVMKKLIEEEKTVFAEQIIVKNYLRRLLNAAYSKKDIKALLPEGVQVQMYGWCKHSEIVHKSMSREHIAAFKEKEQRHSAMLAERLLTNLLEFP